MVELIILSVVVAALVIAGVWYLLVRRSANEPARRAVEPTPAPAAVAEPDPDPEPEPEPEPAVVEPEPAPDPDAVAEPVAEETPIGVLSPDAVRLSGTATTKEAAIAEVGELLVKVGAVEPGYVDSMLARERSVSTYMGNLLAIPHGTNAAQNLIRRSAIAVVRYPDGIDWNGNSAKFVVGIAGADDQHVRILSGIAGIFLDSASVASLTAATSVAEVMAIFAPVDEGL